MDTDADPFDPFIVSTEEIARKSTKDGYHIGTIESVAREFVRDHYALRRKQNMPTRTLALLRHGRIVDLYDDAGWSSERE